MTPFSNISNITSNVDSIESVSLKATFSTGTGCPNTGPLTYVVEKNGLFAGGTTGSSGGWYQGDAYDCSATYSAVYYPPEGSTAEEYVIIDTVTTRANSGDKLFAVEEGGKIVVSISYKWGSYGGSGEHSLHGTMIYLKE